MPINNDTLNFLRGYPYYNIMNPFTFSPNSFTLEQIQQIFDYIKDKKEMESWVKDKGENYKTILKDKLVSLLENVEVKEYTKTCIKEVIPLIDKRLVSHNKKTVLSLIDKILITERTNVIPFDIKYYTTYWKDLF